MLSCFPYVCLAMSTVLLFCEAYQPSDRNVWFQLISMSLFMSPLIWLWCWLIQSHTVERIFSLKICLLLSTYNAVTWILGMRCVWNYAWCLLQVRVRESSLTAWHYILLPFCSTKEIDGWVWRLWHYLTCLVKDSSLIWSALTLTDSHPPVFFHSGVEKYLQLVSQKRCGHK